MKKMKITIKKDGTQQIEVLGAHGDECVKFTEELEKRLGEPAKERELKPEFDEACESTGTEEETERGV